MSSRLLLVDNSTYSFYQCNGAWDVEKKTVKNGDTIKVYTYDNRKLLIQKRATETGDVIRYAYDAAGNRSSMTDETGTSTYRYDDNNRLLEIKKDGLSQISYAYDQIGNIRTVTDRKGLITNYTYDKSSRMESVTSGDSTTTYAYDENGDRKSISYSGGVKKEYSYDKNNRLLSLTNRKPGGGVLSKYSYTYDLTGRQITKTDSYGTTNYTYDNDGRIIKQETPGKTTVYTYDAAGNRLTQNETYTSAQPAGFVDESTGSDIQIRQQLQCEVTNYIYDRQHVILETDADSVKVRYNNFSES